MLPQLPRLPHIDLREPEYKRVFSVLKGAFHNRYLHFPRNFKLVLLCGKSLDNADTRRQSIVKRLHALLNNKPKQSGNTSNRSALISYTKNKQEDIHYILAEKILHDDFDKSGLDLLRGEESLGKIVDCIVLFLESWGTAAELGAFALSKTLCKKMLVINDSIHRNSTSFIAKGPLKLIDNVSTFAPVHYYDLNNISGKLEDIVSNVRNASGKTMQRIHLPVGSMDDLEAKQWMLLICDLINILQPINIFSIEYAVKEILGGIPLDILYALLSIAIEINLVIAERFGSEKLYYLHGDIHSEGYFSNIDVNYADSARMELIDVVGQHSPDFLNVLEGR